MIKIFYIIQSIVKLLPADRIHTSEVVKRNTAVVFFNDFSINSIEMDVSIPSGRTTWVEITLLPGLVVILHDFGVNVMIIKVIVMYFNT